MPDEETVDVESVTPATVRARARRHEFTIDKLPASGGGDAAPMASEYWLASLASCTVTTAHRIASKRRVDLARVRIHARLWIDNGLITNVRLEIRTEGTLSPEERATVFRLAERACTVSRASSVPVEHAFVDGA